MKGDKMFEFDFSAWASSIESQANEQGLTLGSQAEKMQCLSDAALLLYQEELLNEKYYEKVTDKLQKKINKEVKVLT